MKKIFIGINIVTLTAMVIHIAILYCIRATYEIHTSVWWLNLLFGLLYIIPLGLFDLIVLIVRLVRSRKKTAHPDK